MGQLFSRVRFPHISVALNGDIGADRRREIKNDVRVGKRLVQGFLLAVWRENVRDYRFGSAAFGIQRVEIKLHPDCLSFADQELMQNMSGEVVRQ